jgi:hypothetical protein
VLSLVVWSIAALFIDLTTPWLRLPVAIAFGIAILAVLILIRGALRKTLACLVGFAAVLAWWLTIAPSNDRAWQGDVARAAWADIDGDIVTIHDLRNFEYRTETDYTPRWEERAYDLSQICGVDLFITYWGIALDRSSDRQLPDRTGPACRDLDRDPQDYFAFRGFFRQYELIYIIADERDLIGLRTNYRSGEEVYLYHTTATADAARAIFLDYLRSANELHARPAFYNALTSNCTTNIRLHAKAAGSKAAPWDWRLLLNGKSDEFAYQYGRLAGNLPFAALKEQAHINEAAHAADAAAEFSALIRQGRVGFEPAAVQ